MPATAAGVTEIMGSTFAHCKHLQNLSLPQKLRRIEQEAFLKCTSLKEVSVPPTLARRAFAGKSLPGGEHTPEQMHSSSVTT